MMKKRSAALKRMAGWIVPVAVAVGIAFVCSRYFYQLMLIQGDSMSPTYHHLQMAVLDKRDRAFQAGDVVAFDCRGLSATLVKRVAAVPGDNVVIENGVLLVNGAPSPVYGEAAFAFAGLLERPIALGEDEYVVIGDNIDESKDSRYAEVGVVRAEDIIGKLIATQQAPFSA